MNNKFNFYAVVGSNGYGILNSWSDVERCRKYFKQVNCKGFYIYQDAYTWLKAEFCKKYSLGSYNFIPMQALKAEELHFLKQEMQ